MSPPLAALELALDLSPEAVAIVGPDLVFRHANRRYATRMARPREEIVGARMPEILGPEIWAVAEPHVREALRGLPQVFTVEREILGQRRAFELRYTPRLGPAGVEDFVAWVVEVGDDAPRVRAEHEAQFRQLFGSIEQGCAIHELVRDAAGEVVDYRYLEVNPAFERMTGIARARWVGRTVREVLGEVDPFWVETFGRVASTGEPIHLERHSREVGRTYEIFAYPNGPERFAVLIRDITARLAEEEGMRQAQRLESLGVLAGGIAHDFNNILAAVLGNLNLAQLKLDEEHPLQAQFDTMERGLLRARGLIRQLLAYSGRGRVERRPIDFGELVRSIADLLRVSVTRKVKLEVDVAPGLPAIDGDEAQLQQVVLNLVTNASEAIGGQSGTVRVEARAVHLDEAALAALPGQGLVPGDHVALTVSDDGVGMSPELLARIFEPYFSTKAPGRGLGLSAIRGILKGHGAGMAVESRPGEGSCFRAWFPALPPLELGPQPVRPTPGRGSGRVLFVDDEALLHQTVPAMLQAIGYEVDAVHSGEEALARLRQDGRRYRAVLLDLTMPGMGGAGALPAIRGLVPDLPVVLCTGDRSAASEALVSMAATVLSKPFTLDGLRGCLAEVLRG